MSKILAVFGTTGQQGGSFIKYVLSNLELSWKCEIRAITRGVNSEGSFMEDFQSHAFLAPQEAPDGSWIIARHTSPKTQYPLTYAVGDTGKFVDAILAEPDKYEGKTFCAATALYSFEEVASIISKATGETFIFKQIAFEDFKTGLSLKVLSKLSR